jgi:chromosome segregation ATPase
MKLAEALIQRADAQTRLQQLRDRLQRSASVQEGDEPPEDPQELLGEVDNVLAEISTLIKQINRTNAATRFDDERTLTEALADRDILMTERSVLTGVIGAARPQMRYGRMEIKYEATVSIAGLQNRIDDISRRYRELDSAIQQLNWTVDLIED